MISLRKMWEAVNAADERQRKRRCAREMYQRLVLIQADASWCGMPNTAAAIESAIHWSQREDEK